MRELGPDRLSEDGRFLILRDPATTESFRVPADRRLASLIDASTRAGSGTSGPLETPMESTLTPREIQTRIRRGDSPTQVAEAAGVPVQQIAGFAAPVLAEREFMAEQARRTTIRRKHVGGAGALLGTLVDERVASAGGVPEEAGWDAWRREDGRWTVVVRPDDDPAPATFLFDVKSRYVLPADDRAHDLVGDVALPDSSDMAIADALRPEPAQPTEPARATAPPEPALAPRQEHAAPAPAEPETGTLFDVEELTDGGARISSLKEARDRKALEQLALGGAEEPDAPVVHGRHRDADHVEDEDEGHVAVPDTVAPRKKKHERRRVPSWDEIMFGGRDD